MAALEEVKQLKRQLKIVKEEHEILKKAITSTYFAKHSSLSTFVKDLYTKELVGYAIHKRMTAKLVCRALNMAIKNKRPNSNLIVHSDRGSQYCSNDIIRLSRSISLQVQCLGVTTLTMLR